MLEYNDILDFGPNGWNREAVSVVADDAAVFISR